jgi:hypothetical protein
MLRSSPQIQALRIEQQLRPPVPGRSTPRDPAGSGTHPRRQPDVRPKRLTARQAGLRRGADASGGLKQSPPRLCELAGSQSAARFLFVFPAKHIWLAIWLSGSIAASNPPCIGKR